MVTVNFKLSGLGSLQSDLIAPTKFAIILEQCALKTGQDFGSVIAVRNGKVLSLRDAVTEGDVIDVFPAISGG